MKAKEQLKLRQELLRAEIRLREAGMQNLTDQLEENFGRVLLNSVLPVNRRQLHSINHSFDSVSNFLNSFLGGNKSASKYEGLFKSAQVLAAGVAWRYLRKLIFK